MLKKALRFTTGALNSVDIFDDPVHLNLKGERTVTSSVGGVISLAVIIFLAVQSIIQVVAMFNRDDPSIIQMYEYQDDPEILYLNKTNNFMFAVSFTNNNAPMNLSEDSLFSFTSTFSQYVRNEDGSQTKYKPAINWAPCNESDFSSHVFQEGTFKSYSLQYGYCPTYINYTDTNTGDCPSFIVDEYPSCITPLDFNVRGNFLSDYFNFISFRLTTCNQEDALSIYGLQCKSGDITSEFSGNELQINLYYSNSLIDPTDHKTPNKTFLDTVYWNVNPSVSRVADIFIDSETVQDLDSYISTDASHNSTYYSIQSDKMRELQQFSTSYMLQWNFRRSNVNHVTTRTYTKILDVISDIGGIGGILMVVGVVLTAGYTKFKYQMMLSNKLYDYQTKSKTQKQREKTKKAPQEIKKVVRSDVSEVAEGEKNDALDITVLRKLRISNPAATIKKYFEHLFEIKRILPFDEFHYIKSLLSSVFWKNDTEEKLAEKGRNQIQQDLDVIKIVEKLQEIDKLKMLLLNRYQREAFNFIERPLLTLEEKTPRHRRGSKYKIEVGNTAEALFEQREEYESLSKYAKLYTSYRCLVSDTESHDSKYNKKLLEMLGEDLIKVFKHIDQQMGENLDPGKFEEIVNKIMGESQSQNQNENDLSQMILNISKY